MGDAWVGGGGGWVGVEYMGADVGSCGGGWVGVEYMGPAWVSGGGGLKCIA